MAVIIPNAEIVAQSGRLLSLKLPAFAVTSIASLCAYSKLQHNGYLSARFELPRKPRTRGQQGLLHSLLGQLAEKYGTFSLEEMKQIMKWDSVDWPRKRAVIHGQTVEIVSSEADADTVLESKAIEWCYAVAAENGWTLREGNDI